MWYLEFLEKTNYIVTGLTACFILYTQSVAAVYFASGAVLCTASVKILKRLLRLPRPVREQHMKKTYGMPSTHSATITYYAVFICLSCFYLPIHKSLPSGAMTGFLPMVASPLIAGCVILSRIWLGHHTWPQVLVGCAHGASFAGLWFNLWCSGWNEIGQKLERWLETYFAI